jgi:endonuclease III
VSWRHPRAERVRAIRERLRTVYGVSDWPPHGQPLDELVLTVLSQSTNDRNRDVAYERLRERFPAWRAVRDAPVEEVEEAIRPGGISHVKSERIQRILRALPEDLDLSFLRDMPIEDARPYLCDLPGVGRKTAACVLLFSFGRPEIPVDTHVYRVGGRLGLIRHRASFDQAHDEILRVIDPEDAYELHINLIRHGRAVCRPRPRCDECALRRMCPYWRRLAMARRQASETGVK